MSSAAAAKSGAFTAVRPKIAAETIAIAFSVKEPVMLWGPPGIGKSDLVEYIASKDNRPVIDMRLVLLDPTDLKGIPFYCAETNTMKWAAPNDLPQVINNAEVGLAKAIHATALGELNVLMGKITEADRELSVEYQRAALAEEKARDKLATIMLRATMGRAVLFLDEINSAPASIQAAAYQLILNRKIGTYTLPEDVVVICAGNREGDGGIANRMPTPLANRLIHIEMESNSDDWITWALESGAVDNDIISYIAGNTGSLFTFNAANKDQKAFGTPRSWVKFSKIHSAHKQKPFSEMAYSALLGGAVGVGEVAAFKAHLQNLGAVPDTMLVLTQGVAVPFKIEDKRLRTCASYAVILSAINKLREVKKSIADKTSGNVTDDTYNQYWNNFLEFIMANIQDELCVTAITIAIRQYKVAPNASKCPALGKFSTKYSKAMSGAA